MITHAVQQTELESLKNQAHAQIDRAQSSEELFELLKEGTPITVRTRNKLESLAKQTAWMNELSKRIDELGDYLSEGNNCDELWYLAESLSAGGDESKGYELIRRLNQFRYIVSEHLRHLELVRQDVERGIY
jgi:hypothetical protein